MSKRVGPRGADAPAPEKAALRITTPPKIISHFTPAVGNALLYSPMLQGSGTNQLTQLSTRRTAPVVDSITGLATVTSGSLTVFIEKYNELTGGLRLSTHKLLDICTIALTSQNGYGETNLKTLVAIPLEEYMGKCGIPLTKASKDKTRRRVKEDLDTLYSISMEWSETSRGQTVDFAKMRLCDTVGIRGGKIYLNFSLPMTRYLTHAYIMRYPLQLFKVSEKNTNSFYFGKKLLLHYSIENNRKRGTHNIMSVRALIEHVPDLPTYEDVMSAGRQLTQRIIEPFERDMNALDSILKWEYCSARGVPLSEAQLKNFSYGVFIECYVRYDVLDYAG